MVFQFNKLPFWKKNYISGGGVIFLPPKIFMFVLVLNSGVCRNFSRGRGGFSNKL